MLTVNNDSFQSSRASEPSSFGKEPNPLNDPDKDVFKDKEKQNDTAGFSANKKNRPESVPSGNPSQKASNSEEPLFLVDLPQFFEKEDEPSDKGEGIRKHPSSQKQAPSEVKNPQTFQNTSRKSDESEKRGLSERSLDAAGASAAADVLPIGFDGKESPKKEARSSEKAPSSPKEKRENPAVKADAEKTGSVSGQGRAKNSGVQRSIELPEFFTEKDKKRTQSDSSTPDKALPAQKRKQDVRPASSDISSPSKKPSRSGGQEGLKKEKIAPEEKWSHAHIATVVCMCLLIPAALVAVLAVVAVFAALFILFALLAGAMSIMLIAVVIAGVVLALVGTTYGAINLLTGSGFALITGQYELGLGLAITGITIIVSALLYSGVTGLVPFLCKKLWIFAKFLSKKLKKLVLWIYKFSTQF